MPALAMALFVSPADVILRMQLSAELDGIDDVVASGIVGAQLHVQRVIGGHLVRRTQSCQFFVDAEAFSGIAPGGTYRLEIPSGFIRRDTPVVVTASWPELQGGPFLGYESADMDLIQIDYDRGYLLLDAYEYGNSYVRVACDTGFEDGTRPISVTGIEDYDGATAYILNDQVVLDGVAYTCVSPTTGTPPPDAAKWEPALAPIEQIPNDLYEAIMALVPMVFNSSQTTTGNPDATTQYRTLTDHAEFLLQAYVRTKGFTFRPT